MTDIARFLDIARQRFRHLNQKFSAAVAALLAVVFLSSAVGLQSPAAETTGDTSASWYKDAVIYEVHVKSYCDSNGDGYGDLKGLTGKLDYIKALGVNCIWLLPFYPSPLKDDGYDIADYEGVNPIYGNISDFKKFLDEAHSRGIRVITELVINHTSDQHPWFQRARSAPAGSKERDFYVWSNTDQKYKGVRIIFTDTEKSNWTYDPVAKAYFWHRFFSHQPDLNYDNPEVLKEVVRVMRLWLDMGVDGLRLDAIPYLVERQGTSCENLPETHAILKQLRKELDAHYQSRLFLAEANMWPKDTIKYFGDSDECQMAYHFPVMPRLYLALAKEDRHPIEEIMKSTPAIPQGCQWGMFLRNHDELTLEMVTDEERAQMWKSYAPELRMHCNIGIRRRLAPLMEFSRPKIELLNSLLLSLPGTPVLYYGDEIGMGDDIWLKDRDGLRTPMQWSSDRNAGFSRASWSKLYSAPINDPIAGYQAINVEAEELNPSSQLKWMTRILDVRKANPVFSRGRLDFVEPDNDKVLAYVRKWENDTVLVVANLASSAQSTSIDLSKYKGLNVSEIFGNGAFAPITDKPYVVTLAPHSFYWLKLQ